MFFVCLSIDYLLEHVDVGPRVLVRLQGDVGGEELSRGGAVAGYVDREALPGEAIGGVILHQLSRKSPLHGRSCEND